MKALALFSGGLDSGLAIKIIQEQGIEVIALNFVSYYFGGKNPKIEDMSKQLDVKVEYIDFKEEQKKIVENPVFGHGKNMNPCIDCHGLMLKIAGNLLKKYNADFVITGEVLGQRPMSQNLHALSKVEELSGIKGLIVRPLSAKHLKETIPEEKGWIDRSKLLNLSGRSRKPQMDYAHQYNITKYPSPAGGCLLTDPLYSKRLRYLLDDKQFEYSYLFEVIKHGRFFRLDEGKYIIAGRRLEDNENIENFKDKTNLFIKGDKTAGPSIFCFGDLNKEEQIFAKEIFSRYSSTKGKDICSILVNGVHEEINKIDVDLVQEKINKYIIM